jgi:HD-GYP domain-containing protein (c-di-GMP phosphodiesterase class II)
MSYWINLFRVVDSLSSALDLVGVDDVQHGKRVGIMATRIAEELGWSVERRQELLMASFLHDCGVSTTSEHGFLVTELEWSNAQEHCLRGEKFLSDVPLFRHLAPYIRYHHTRWEHLIAQGVPTPVAEMANLIFLSDRLDSLRTSYGANDAFNHRGEFFATLVKYDGVLFNPDFTRALVKRGQSEAFWFSLDPQLLEFHVREQAARGRRINIDQIQLRSVAIMFARIIDAKSSFTADHSVLVAQLAKFIATGLGLAADTCDAIEIAGYLHDLGKLRVPDAILDKHGPLDAAERLTMNRHSYDTYEILFRLFGDDSIALWAAYHHETVNGQGYPFQVSGDDLPFEARILAIADVFQALAQNRPYREPMPAAQVIAVLDEQTAAGRLDPVIVQFVHANLERCWSAAGGRGEGLGA